MSMPMPQGKADITRRMNFMSKAVLGVSIHLLPEELEKAQLRKLLEEPPTMIGTICLGWGRVSPAIVDNRTASISISIARDCQDKGYGREDINWMLDWAFRRI
jgi:RimJ/RimL family protein N-acetyltransferase